MPHLDAAALTADPEGVDFLRRALDTGDPVMVPSRSAFIPTQAPTPATSTSSERPLGRAVLAIAEAA